jgi:chromosome segregation protein
LHLKSLTLKGFKSFPDRTRLDFGPGVSVVVGPNGSGKSNVTDAVLWAMGEQSPLAIRGGSMQDVIFGGGRGIAPRSAAEVEIVLDNSDGTVALPLSEISIVRRLDRNGEAGYLLNGARARLTDVIEVLSDTGLGKETHSVISQGRVDAIVTSKPRDRRMLIEEAAGLGKHRKRRRRAQLKLERTQENLDRALDIEREARTRLRPLKRQAEAADLHERLELQILQARLALALESSSGRRRELSRAEAQVAAARGARAALEASLQETVDRRGAAERALAERAERHDALSRRLYETRSAGERLELRAEQAQASVRTLSRRIERVAQELAGMQEPGSDDRGERERSSQDAQRVVALEGELDRLRAGRELELERELEQLAGELQAHEAALESAEAQRVRAGEAGEAAEHEARRARERLAAAEREAQEARREAERIGAELAAANQFLRAHARFDGERSDAPRALSEDLRVSAGYELALAAALGGRLDAAVVSDVAGAHAVLDRAGPDGGGALLAAPGAAGSGSSDAAVEEPPAPGARRLMDLLSGPAEAVALAARLLADAWVVERLEDLPEDFGGIAVTQRGRVWFGSWGEVRQLSEGGSELVLARRNERDALIAASERAAQTEILARARREDAQGALRGAEDALLAAQEALRAHERAVVEAGETLRRTGWLIEQRRSAPAEGPLAVRQAELEGELAAERRAAERVERDRVARLARLQRLRAQHAADSALAPLAGRLAPALRIAGEAVDARRQALEHELAGDRLAGERMAGELRACAARESELQAELRSAGEAVTAAEVSAQRVRDQAADAELELTHVAGRLGVALSVGSDGETVVAGEEPQQALGEQERTALEERVQRLTRRREQLGPVNPLAAEEYGQAVEHVDELERQRGDLETALRELRGVIRDTDRQIEETFEQTYAAAARNFRELVGDVFPGGSGALRLVAEEVAPRAVLGGQPLPDAEQEERIEAAAEAESQAQAAPAEEQELPGVEIEITPAGKSTKRLSLLSGGEKSMTALAFLFAVFLARPCPFYILDEVEAALDDLNLDRFLSLLRRYADRAQFIVITHQKRTMEAADWLYGVSMGADGVSKVLSRRLPSEAQDPERETAAVA